MFPPERICLKIFGIICLAFSTTQDATGDMKRYEAPHHGYALQWPSNCNVEQNVAPDKDFSVTCPGNHLTASILGTYSNLDLFRKEVKSGMTKLGATSFQDNGVKELNFNGIALTRASQRMLLNGSRLEAFEYAFKIGARNYMLLCQEFNGSNAHCDQIAQTIRMTPPGEDGFLRYHSDMHGYSIEFPSDSTVERGNKPGIDFSVRESNPRLGLTVITRELEKPISLEMFVDSINTSFREGTLKKGNTDFRRAGEGQWQTNGIDVVWRALVFKAKDVPTKHLYYAFKRNPWYFIISCTGNTDIQPRCDQIAHSIKWE